MFTGIIEGLGSILNIRTANHGTRVVVNSDFILEGSKIGDSIAVSGVCVTVVKIDKNKFEVDISPETIDKSIFNKAKVGDIVNIERALRLSDRLDGHLVSGHVDGTGIMKSKKKLNNSLVISFSVGKSLSEYMIPKGSVAIDGISLTINNCKEQGFDVCIIPHTAKLTTLGIKESGDFVNIETDMIGKYVKKFIFDKDSKTKSVVDESFLTKHGFF